MAIYRPDALDTVVVAPPDSSAQLWSVRADAGIPKSVQRTQRPVVGAVLVALLAAGLVASVVLFATPGRGPTYAPATGLSAFAIFYVAAQFAERLAELFVWLLDPAPLPGFGKTAAKEERERSLVAAERGPSEQSAQRAAEAQAEVDRITAERTLLTFGITAAIGMCLCGWLEADFLTAVGVSFGPAGTIPSPTAQAAAMAVTGAVVGGGAKGLHDLLSRMSKAAVSAGTPKGLVSIL